MANSVVLSASAQVFSGIGTVTGVILVAGSDAATVDLADKVGSGGTSVLHAGQPVASTPTTPHLGRGRVFNTGCYATISGTSPKVTILFDEA